MVKIMVKYKGVLRRPASLKALNLERSWNLPQSHQVLSFVKAEVGDSCDANNACGPGECCKATPEPTPEPVRKRRTLERRKRQTQSGTCQEEQFLDGGK